MDGTRHSCALCVVYRAVSSYVTYAPQVQHTYYRRARSRREGARSNMCVRSTRKGGGLLHAKYWVHDAMMDGMAGGSVSVRGCIITHTDTHDTGHSITFSDFSPYRSLSQPRRLCAPRPAVFLCSPLLWCLVQVCNNFVTRRLGLEPKEGHRAGARKIGGIDAVAERAVTCIA